jgi:hypothetical protein
MATWKLAQRLVSDVTAYDLDYRLGWAACRVMRAIECREAGELIRAREHLDTAREMVRAYECRDRGAL